jgi:hypothetical protein
MQVSLDALPILLIFLWMTPTKQLNARSVERFRQKNERYTKY